MAALTRRRLSLVLVASALTATSAHAQGQSDVAFANRRLLDPTLESSVRTSEPLVVLSAERGNGKASAQVSFGVAGLDLIVGASAPFTGNASDPDTELLSKDDLVAETTLSFTLTGFQWGPLSLTDRQQAARNEWCAAQQARGTLPRTMNCDLISESILERLDDAGQANPLAPEAVERLVADFERVRRLGWDIPIQYAVEAKMTPRNFDFRDPTTLEAGSAEHIAFSVGGGVGVFVNPFTRLDADLSYERGFRAGQSTEVCTPLPPPQTSQCAAAVLGGPTRSDGWIAEAGVRKLLRVGGFDVGVNPRVRYRNDDQTYTVRMPIYLIPEKSGTALVGGITPTWNSDSRRFGLVLFVGSAFNLDSPIR